jgi:signal transduction histidine kinase
VTEIATTPDVLVRRWPERRAVVLSTAAVLLVADFVAVLAAGDVMPGLALLGVVAVLLAALELGLWGGLCAAGLAIALLVVNAPLDAVATISYSLAFVTVSGIAGHFSDRLHDAYDQEQRLLQQEREAAELRRVRDDLLEQRSGLGHLLDLQEDERTRVAERLHEDLAQVLSAVLLGVRVLRRGASEDGAVQLDQLHEQIVRVLEDMRSVAASLRPSSLAYLGLVPALEALGESAGCVIEVEVGDIPEPLRTGIYRLVEQAVSARRPGSRANVSLRARERELELAIDVSADEPEIVLAAARARAGVLEGSLVVEPAVDGRTRMRVHVPLPR